MWFVKLIFFIVFVFGVGALLLNLTPTDVKMQGLSLLEKAVPKSVNDKITDLTLTPSEKRDKLISKLDSQLEDAAHEGGISDDSKKIIEEARKTLSELDLKNHDASLTEVITAKLADTVLGKKTECEE